MSRIEEGQVGINPVLTDLIKLTENIISELKIDADKKLIVVNFEVENSIKEILIDPAMVIHVVHNLLNNAIKYSPDKTEINIKLHEVGKFLEFSIKDHGCGIPSNQTDKIGHRFFRATNAVNFDANGSGLGLYLAKSIVEASGGELWFDTKEDEGSTFYFTLPLIGSAPKKGYKNLI
ncbi:MAG: HAMP domain-containing sensor histidine kinase [bacterium]|nr:HAMP domain-containing sensor histidine kinase [bacterium]